MKIAIPIFEKRISPVLDVAKQFLLIDFDSNRPVKRGVVRIESTELVTKAKRIIELDSQVLICGAISWPLEAMLVSAGMRVIPNTCGSVDEVIDAFVAGTLNHQGFLMPGCKGRGRQRRYRQRRSHNK